MPPAKSMKAAKATAKGKAGRPASTSQVSVRAKTKPAPSVSSLSSTKGKGREVLSASSRCCLEIAATLPHAELPVGVLEMLQAMLHESLGVPKAQRHAYQESVAGMVGEVLREMEEELRSAVDQALVIVEEAHANKAAREAARLAAETSRQAWAGIVAQRREARQADGAPLEQAAAAVVEAEASVKAHNAAIADLTEKQHLLRTIVGPACGSEGKADELELARALRVLDFDKSLAEAAQLSLRRDTATRSQFDAMVIKEFECACDQKAAELEEAVAAKEGGRGDLVVASEAASRVASTAQAAADASARLLNEALKDEAESKEHEQATLRAVQSFLGELRAAADALDLKSKALADFRAGPLAALSELEAIVP